MGQIHTDQIFKVFICINSLKKSLEQSLSSVGGKWAKFPSHWWTVQAILLLVLTLVLCCLGGLNDSTLSATSLEKENRLSNDTIFITNDQVTTEIWSSERKVSNLFGELTKNNVVDLSIDSLWLSAPLKIDLNWLLVPLRQLLSEVDRSSTS